MFFLLLHEAAQEKFEAAKRGNVDQEIHEVNERIFPIRRGFEDFEKEAKNPGIKRAPIRVDGVVPIATPVGVPNIEIRNTIGIHGEAGGPRIGSAQREDDEAAANSEQFVIRIAVLFRM